jgi:excisionase family DNA binding protein
MAEKPNPEKVAWTVKTFCQAVEISNAYCYELLNAGTIQSVKVGGKRLIVTSPREFIASLAEAA